MSPKPWEMTAFKCTRRHFQFWQSLSTAAPVASSPVTYMGVGWGRMPRLHWGQSLPEFTATLHKILPALRDSAPVSWKAKHSQGISTSITAPPQEGADKEWNSKSFPTQQSVLPKQLHNRQGQSAGHYYLSLGGLDPRCRMWSQDHCGSKWANYFLPKREETGLWQTWHAQYPPVI